MLLFALAAGAMSGVVLLFFSHLAPVFGAGNFIRDLDQPHICGQKLTRREAHFLGALVHVLMSSFFGGAYAYLVMIHLFSGHELISLLGWSLILSLFVGGVILPLEGHGIFGVKEDAWFPVDLVLTNAAWSIIFWWIMQLWPVSAVWNM